VVSSSNGAATTLITADPHCLSNNDTVVLCLHHEIGCEIISYSQSWTVTVLSPSSFSIPYNTTNCTRQLTGKGHRPLDLTGRIYTGEIYRGQSEYLGGGTATGAVGSSLLQIELPIEESRRFEGGGEITVAGATYTVLDSIVACTDEPCSRCATVSLVLDSVLPANVNGPWTGKYYGGGSGEILASLSISVQNTLGAIDLTTTANFENDRSYNYVIFEAVGPAITPKFFGEIAFDLTGTDCGAVATCVSPYPVIIANPQSIANIALSVPNLAALTALNTSALPLGTVRQPLGYYAAGDREMPIYILEARNSRNPNFGILVQADNTAFIWAAKYTEIHSDWFGTRKTVGLDDAPALQAAINFAFQSSNLIHLDPGTYHLANRVLVESGFGADRIRKINGHGAILNNALHIGASEGVLVEGIVFDSTPQEGIRMSRCQGGGLLNCVFQNCGAQGLLFAPVPGALGGAKSNCQITNGVFSNLVFDGCAGYAIEFIGEATANASWVNSNNFDKISINACGGGLRQIPGIGPGGGSALNYNNFIGFQVEITNTGLSLDLPLSGVAGATARQNVFVGCHFTSEVPIGVNDVPTTVRIEDIYNVIIGGRTSDRISAPDIGFYWINSGYGGTPAAQIPSDNGVFASFAGVQKYFGQELSVENLIIANGFSITQVPVVTPAIDGQSSHAIGISLANMPINSTATIRCAIGGQRALNTNVNAATIACGEAIIHATRSAAGVWACAGAISGATGITLNSISIAGTNECRINFNSTPIINSWQAVAEIKTSGGAILD
jgi:hypothetical protein